MASAALGTAYRHLRDLFTAGSTLGVDDGPLLARYSRSNDPAAFEALVSRHGPMVLATCRAVLGNEHDAEDAFQATFLVLARKAGSVRGGEALGGWLHRVARRASVQASLEARRRRIKEVEAARIGRDSSRPETELAAWLHEEIDRLPESLRLPVVLCDLESLTYEQAAERLGWTLPKLRHRLADGRRKLKARLLRRGALPLAIGASLVSKAPAAVPECLVRSVVASATGGATSAGVGLLTHTLLRGMLVTRIKLLSAATLAAVALVSAGVLAAGRAFEDSKPGPPSAPQATILKEAPAEELIDVRGIVVGPDGHPVAGASVYAVRPVPFPETTSGPDGRFHLRVPHPEPRLRRILKQYPQVIASKLGFGLNQGVSPYPPEPANDLSIKLLEDGPPIEGRVLDLEGRPVVGATVHPNAIYDFEGGNLDPWIAKVKDKEARSFDGLRGIVVMKGEVATDRDGRFRLAGLGRERIASLYITGPTIASSEVNVLLRDGPGFQGLDRSYMMPKAVVYHPTRFDVALPPTKPIEGMVRDKDTGRPIEGLTILARIFDPYNQNNRPASSARTDAQGRYRLTGLAKAPAYRVSVHPASRQDFPYLDESRKIVAETPGLEPVAFDIALKRAVEIRGRVVDKATGQPVAGTVSAFTFNDNPNLGDYPGFSEGYNPASPTDEDGRYRVLTLPGRGVLAFQASRDSYRNGLGAEAIPGYDPKRRGFPGTIPREIASVNFHALAEVNPKPGNESTTLDLAVESGRALDLAVVGPDGRPLIGELKAEGTSPQLLNLAILVPGTSSTVGVIGLEPEKPRRVTVFHDARKLVGSIRLKGNEDGRLTLRLQPWGSVVGRVLAIEGSPRQPKALNAGNNTPGTKLEEVGILPGSATGALKVGKDGRFRVDGLVPGLKYAGSASDGEVILGDVFKDVTVKPGEIKDLGDLQVTPYKP